MKTLLSIYDYSGRWSKPYLDAGWNVIRIDIKLGIDILTWDYKSVKADGILLATPCTDYALSGAKHFARKDADGTTAKSQLLMDRNKEIIEYQNPEFWGLENPMSRIHKLNSWLGNPVLKFNPCDYCLYADDPETERYNKQTWIWGKFNVPDKKGLPALHKDFPGFTKLGGKSERTKELRSMTPTGFANAFFKFNH